MEPAAMRPDAPVTLEALNGAAALEGTGPQRAAYLTAACASGLTPATLFVGYDEDTGQGRIFSYDVAGGPYEEQRFFSIGSGSLFARGALKKLYADGMSADDVVLACVQALYDAADDDSATGGPDAALRARQGRDVDKLR